MFCMLDYEFSYMEQMDLARRMVLEMQNRTCYTPILEKSSECAQNYILPTEIHSGEGRY